MKKKKKNYRNNRTFVIGKNVNSNELPTVIIGPFLVTKRHKMPTVKYNKASNGYLTIHRINFSNLLTFTVPTQSGLNPYRKFVPRITSARIH